MSEAAAPTAAADGSAAGAATADTPTPDAAPDAPTTAASEVGQAASDPSSSSLDAAPVAEASATPETESEPKSEPKAEAKPKPKLPKAMHKPGKSCRESFAVGQKVKNFRLSNVDGSKTISPAGYRGRVVLLNFWGTWCEPCLKELPEFDRLYRRYRRHGMTLVAVATDEDPGPVADFVAKHKLSAKIALAGEAAAGAYKQRNFPFSFVVAGDGEIVAAFEYVEDKCLGDLEAAIRDELARLD